MRYYLDTEFNSMGGALMSLALVREDGASFYAVKEMPHPIDPWVAANVVPILYDVDHQRDIQGWYSGAQHGHRYYMHLGENIATFLKGDPKPHIIADWPDDLRYLCAELITGPGEMVDIPALVLEVARVDAYPTTLPGAIQHNAWWDAMSLRHLLTMTEAPAPVASDGDASNSGEADGGQPDQKDPQ
jgi:hypothetical protein